MIGAVVRAQLDNLKVNEQEGGFVGYSEQDASTQKSGLWRLPNVDVLFLPYNIDVMHTEKNLNEALWGKSWQLWGTIMDISDKTKDNVKARVDQSTLCKRPKLNMATTTKTISRNASNFFRGGPKFDPLLQM